MFPIWPLDAKRQKREGVRKMRASVGVNADLLRISQKWFTNFCRNSCKLAEREEAYFSLDFFGPFFIKEKRITKIKELSV